jgi:hypothetical protein
MPRRWQPLVGMRIPWNFNPQEFALCFAYFEAFISVVLQTTQKCNQKLKGRITPHVNFFQ